MENGTMKNQWNLIPDLIKLFYTLYFSLKIYFNFGKSFGSLSFLASLIVHDHLKRLVYSVQHQYFQGHLILKTSISHNAIICF